MNLYLRLLACAIAICLLGAAGHAATARADDGGASWVFAPASPPPTPPGAQPSPYPLPLGYVGDIKFWSPNRGLLITAGSGDGVVPEGLYAYDGVTWHELSTVCGGSDGRIAWAGPDEFWTIADQRPGQPLAGLSANALQDISLCHFANGQVVGSYAMPVGTAGSYDVMNAAACSGPSDCWFGGSLDAVRGGAFHLHWDGSSVSVVDGSADHAIGAMTLNSGQIYESVGLAQSDNFGSESRSHPPLLHVVAHSDPANPFHSAVLQDDQGNGFCPTLPEYDPSSCSENSIDPTTLNPLAIDSSSHADPTNPQLWAAAGPNPTVSPASGFTASAQDPIIMRYSNGAWTQVVPNLTSLWMTDSPSADVGSSPTAQTVAAEPGTDAAWVVVDPAPGNPDNQTHVDRVAVTVDSSGSVTGASLTDHDVLGTAQGVGPRGTASAIACAAAQDCWVATNQGWLFHLTDGTQLARDTDANFAGIITSRPTDGGVITAQPAGAIVSSAVPPPPAVPAIAVTKTKPKKARPLVTHLSRSRLVHHTMLELSFTLTARARVQLVARRHKRVVARTRLAILKPGRHTLSLKLNRKRWPTALALNAKSIAAAKS